LPLTRPRVLELLGAVEPDDPAPPRRAIEMPEGEGHALTGDGSATVPASPEDVWATILDPGHLAALIPGCHSLELIAENTYRAEAILGAGPVKGRFTVEVSLSDLEPPRSLHLTGSATGPLGRASGTGEIRLTATEDGTRVDYVYAVLVGGKVAAVGGRLLDGAARGLIGQIFRRLAGASAVDTETGLRAKLLRWLGGSS
ncbi:MAG: carbon monoxide dehydrogenase subunit G, partial [Alphaproteobacteria bacterium]|nr:carbon monoxide dehydrogenase subunit G [Alphaproteobacteria bacterium]